MRMLVLIAGILYGISPAAAAGQRDETGFFGTGEPTWECRENVWRFSNEAISAAFRYDPQAGGLFMDQVLDRKRNRAMLTMPASLLRLTDPAGQTVLDIQQGWDLVAGPFSLRPCEEAKHRGTFVAEFELRSRGNATPAEGPIYAILKIHLFPGDEPYFTVEPILQGRWKEKTHIQNVQYIRFHPVNGGGVVPFADPEAPPPAGIDKHNLSVWSPQRITNHHTLPCTDGSGGLWISAGNYNTSVHSRGTEVDISALANVYLDSYLPLTNGRLGAVMIGVYQGAREAALFDYQLFLIKHWIAGDHRTVPTCYHDYWYATRKGVQEPQPPRMEKLAPLIRECGFGMFWFTYEHYGVWPDWGFEPSEYFPGGANAEDPGSVPAVFARNDIALGLYTAPCVVGEKLKFELRHTDCQLYGDLLGRRARQAKAKFFWYEDSPGENYPLDEDWPNQPRGNCSWMWQEGYRIARQAARKQAPGLGFSRTWVDSVEQLGWAELTSSLDVEGMKGGNQSGGPTREHDLFLADAWRNTVWRLVPVWPLMHQLGHHPVHIRDEKRTSADTEYIDSSAAMYGPFCLNGPLMETTPQERAIHRKWAEFNWKYRQFLRFSALPEFAGESGKVDGVYHLANADQGGLCGFIGLWNKDSEKAAEVTLRIAPRMYRLNWSADMEACVWNSREEVSFRMEKEDYIVGPLKLEPRSSVVLAIRQGKDRKTN